MLFYFSATGNTRKLAGIIAERIGEKAFNIEDLIRDQNFSFKLDDGERLGFLCPVYFGGVPEIVQRFIESVQIQTADHYYGYCVMTYGNLACNAAKRLVKCLLKRGITMNGIFGVKCIDTFLPMYTIPEGAMRERVNAETQLQSEFTAEQIVDKTPCERIHKGTFPIAGSLSMMPLYAMMRKTKYLTVTDQCCGCGLCAENCPEHIIKIDESMKRPVWNEKKCMLCLRCLHHCPKQAIEYGKMTEGKLRYPSVD